MGFGFYLTLVISIYCHQPHFHPDELAAAIFDKERDAHWGCVEDSRHFFYHHCFPLVDDKEQSPVESRSRRIDILV